MRRAFGVVATVALISLAVAGCGSSKAPGVSGALATELSYLPRDDVFTADVATDPQAPAVKSVNALVSSVPAAQLGISALKALLASRGVDYQTDIEPLFGNPVLFAATSFSTASPTGGGFLLVWIPRGSLGLTSLLKGLSSNTPSGHANGATLYGSGSNVYAIQGDTLVFGSSATLVKAALARHASGTGMTPSAFAGAMSNLPSNTFLQAEGSLAGAIHGSALQVPWVAALRGYAATLTGSASGLHLSFRVDTSGRSLSAGQLPLASGTGPPELAGTLPIVVGVRDPASTVAFVEAALRSVDPTAYARFTRAQAAVKGKTGYDLDTLLSLLTGNMIVESNVHTTMVRADVSDPASAARQLAGIPVVARQVFTGSRGISRLAGGFLAVRQSHGTAVVIGLIGREFVAGNATPAQLRAFADAPASPAPNAAGPIAVRISLAELLHLTVGRAVGSALPGFASSLLSNLGDITGSASDTAGALTGTVALSLR